MMASGLLCCTWEQFVLMVSLWMRSAAMRVCSAVREVAEAVTPHSFAQVWYRSYAIRLINRAILEIKEDDSNIEAFHWHNSIETKHVRLSIVDLIHFNQKKIVMHTGTWRSVLKSPDLSKHPVWLSEEQVKGWIGCLSWARYIFTTASAQKWQEK